MVTLTAVDVSPDLSHAKVLLHAPRGREHADDDREGARSAPPGSCAAQLAHRLELYSVPQLHFVYDDSVERGMQLSQLIDEAVGRRTSKRDAS